MLEERTDSIGNITRFCMIDRALLGLDHLGMAIQYVTTGSYL